MQDHDQADGFDEHAAADGIQLETVEAAAALRPALQEGACPASGPAAR